MRALTQRNESTGQEGLCTGQATLGTCSSVISRAIHTVGLKGLMIGGRFGEGVF